MKKALFFAGLAAATLSFVGCNKEADFYGRDGRFEIVLNTEDTRTAIDGMNTVWIDSDQINVFHALTGTTDYKNDTPYADNKQHPFKVADAEAGVFTGELLGGELVEGQSYDWYLYYPYNSYLHSPVNTEDGRNYVGCAGNQVQRQNGNDSMDHLAGGSNTGSFPLYGIATNVPAGTRPQVTMKHIASAVAVKVTNVSHDPVSIVSIKLTAPEAIVGNFYISFEAEPVTLTPYQDQFSNTATLQVQNGEDIPAGGSATFYMGIKPFTAAAGSELTLEITGTNGIVTATKTLTAAAVFTAGKIKTLNVDYDKDHVESEYEWVKTSLDKVATTDEFVFVGHNASGDWALANDKGTESAPTAISVEDVDGKLKKEPTADIIWTLTQGSNAGEYAFSPKGAETFLYTTNTNNGVRIGDNANHFFVLDAGYLKNVGTGRYVGIYLSQDWRCYTSINNNIKEQTFAPYVKYKKGTVTPDKTFQASLVGAEGDGQNLTVSASTTTASVVINADDDIAWTAEPSEGLTLSDLSGTGSATVAVSFAANTSTTEKSYSILVRTDAEGVTNDEYELCITQQGMPAPEAKTFPYTWTFAESQGDFTIENVTLPEGLDYVWSYDTRYHYMKANAYKSETNYATESWLVSPLVDMTGATAPVLSFSHVISKFFGTVEDEATVWIREEGGSWNQLTITYPDFPEGKNFSNWGDVSLDVASYAGKKVQVGFKYVSTREHAGTWEVKNFKLAKAETGPVDPAFTVPSTLSVEAGKTAKINVTTDTDGAITYTSASTAVATVAADGTVTGVAAGTTTITVAAAATANFNAASATVAVTVTAAQTGSHYGKVSTITSGKKYLIAAGGQPKVLGSTLNNGKVAGVAVTITDGKIEANTTTNACAVTITADNEGKYSIVLPDGKYLVYGSSTNLKFSATATDTWTVGTGVQGVFRFTSTATEERALAYRAGSQNCFGAYAVSNLTATSQEYFDIDLYELGAEPTVVPSAVTLSSISVSGQQTAFNLGDTFTFDGTVTATYSDGSTKDVTSSAQITEPDMTTAGTKRVTVSYTEGDVTKSCSYEITVASQGTGGSKVIIIDGSQLTSTATSQLTDKIYDGVTITFSDGAKMQTSNGENKFADKAILIGKKGKYIYNKTAIPGRITKFEVYANKGASAAVTVGINFSDSPISEYNASASNTYTATLSTLDSVYDCSEKLSSNAKYFWYQVTNANNSQIQFRITYE